MPPRKVKAMKGIKIRDIRGNTYFFDYEDIYIYDFEYTPNVLRIDFKDGEIIEFTRRNIVFVEVVVDSGKEQE